MTFAKVKEFSKYASGAVAGVLYTVYAQPVVADFVAWLDKVFNG